jgi:hypothetical protein
MESMPDEYYAPEEINLGPKRANPARGQMFRPGPGKSRPGLAGSS